MFASPHCFSCAPPPALADEPVREQDGLGLKLEELFYDKGTFRLEVGTTLTASRRTGVSSQYQTIEIAPGSFVTLPVEVGASDRRTETALATMALRYGLTTRSEIFARATARARSSRFTDGATGIAEDIFDAAFQSFVIGANLRLLDDEELPGLVGFADVSLVENTASEGADLVAGRSGTLGFTAYRVLDPVVVSLTAGYRINLDRSTGFGSFDPGDTAFVNPSIAFAVNNELTLTGGFGLDYTTADHGQGSGGSDAATAADLQFGLAYAWDKSTTLRADTRAVVLGDDSFSLCLSMTRKFGSK